MSLIAIEKECVNKFAERLRFAMGELTLDSMAELTGIGKATIHRYLNNKNTPDLSKLESIAVATNTPIEWFLTGHVQAENMVRVPHYDLVASAGFGALVEHEKPIAEFSFSHEWLQMQGLLNKTLSILQVAGDSMEPSLFDGDLILIRHEDVKDGICVIRIDNDILVKRVQYDYEEQVYLISSDNKQYKPFKISSNFNGDFQIIGQVVRVLQRVKSYD